MVQLASYCQSQKLYHPIASVHCPGTLLLSTELALSSFPLCYPSTHRRLADVDGDNALSEQEFCTAMKLVLMRRKGHSIPAALPEGVRQKPGDGGSYFWQS